MTEVYSTYSANQNALADYTSAAGLTNFKFDQNLVNTWAAKDYGDFSTSPNVPDYTGDILSGVPYGGNTQAWTFITPPGSVSYTVNSDVKRLDIFGTNSPPVVVSSKGMRDLTLSEALMEGFTLGKSVQLHLDRLENLMDVSVNTSQGFVNVPIYKVHAGPQGGGKFYGYYVIEQIEIEEQLRDLKGNTTRAKVGLNLKEIPEYQVGTGVDQAGASTGGQVLDPAKFTNQANSQAGKIAKNGKNVASGAAGAAGAAGADGAGTDSQGGGAAGSGATGALNSNWRSRFKAETGREAVF